MKYKKSMIIFMLVIFLFAIASASASDVDDALISDEDTGEIELAQDNAVSDSANDLGASEGTYSDLRTEIGNGANITLTKGTYTYNQNDGDTIRITDSCVIDGNGAVIDMAQYNKRAFYVNASEVTFKNLTFRNVYTSNNGGAIYFTGSGTLINCNFINNKGGYGVLYFAKDSYCTLKDCNFENNKAQFGGAIYLIEGSGATITNCNFANNVATFGSGGSIHSRSYANISNCNFTNSKADSGGAIVFTSLTYGNVTNCNFVNNTASSTTGSHSEGGAIACYSLLTLTNCNFTGNRAEANGYGGAVYFYSGGGAATNCNFIDNSAKYQGGAAFISSGDTTFTNCNFTGNNASIGSALYFAHWGSEKNVYDSCFLNNRADAEALEIVKNDDNITITFKGNNQLLNSVCTVTNYPVSFRNVTYWGANGIANTGSSIIKPSNSNNEAGQNVTVMVLVDGIVVLNEVKVTDGNGMIVLPISAGDSYYISARHNIDSYYTEIENSISNNTKVSVDVAVKRIDDKTVNITAISNVPYELLEGELLFVVPNADPIVPTYAGNGTWWALYTSDNFDGFAVSVVVGGDEIIVNNTNITLKIQTQLAANPVTATYNANKYLVITLNDAHGNPVSGVDVTVDLGGVKTYVTDVNGQIKVSTKALSAKTYDAKITFGGNVLYDGSSKVVKVTVNKAANPLKVKAKTVKVKFSKLKKKAVKLKVTKVVKFTKKGQGTLIYKKVKGNKKIKINKKTGKVTIKKGLKKGTYKVRMKIKAKGNANYKASAYKTITFKIKIK